MPYRFAEITMFFRRRNPLKFSTWTTRFVEIFQKIRNVVYRCQDTCIPHHSGWPRACQSFFGVPSVRVSPKASMRVAVGAHIVRPPFRPPPGPFTRGVGGQRPPLRKQRTLYAPKPPPLGEVPSEARRKGLKRRTCAWNAIPRRLRRHTPFTRGGGRPKAAPTRPFPKSSWLPCRRWPGRRPGGIFGGPDLPCGGPRCRRSPYASGWPLPPCG